MSAMADPDGAGARSNTFVLAAVALPIVVAGFFLVASAVPQWTVPAPAHDLLVKVERPWTNRPTVSVDFAVRDGRVVTTVRPWGEAGYSERWTLYLVNPDAGSIRAIPVNAPDKMEAGAPPIEVTVDGLAGLQVSPDAVAPDGYRLQDRSYGGGGLVGGLFGMGRRRPRVAVAKNGRTVSIDVPEQDVNPYGPVRLVGWIVSAGG
jgi:hypothetical protein